MKDIILSRQTYILVTDKDELLYPSKNIYPSQNLFPAEMRRLDKIVQGSLRLDEILVESELQFGQLYSTKFEMQMYDTEDLSGKFIYVFQNNGYEDYRIFAGLIESCKLDRVGTDRTVVAYDLAYSKSYVNVAPWWREFWNQKSTATLKEMREGLLSYVGINYENVELPNDRISLTKTCDINSIGFGAMLKMICELSCCFPHIDRSGTMIFIVLNNDSSVDITGKYDGTQSTFEEYVTESITGVQFYTTNSDLTAVVGDSTNPYSVQENILVYKKTEAELREIGRNMMDYIPEIVYTPSSVSMIISDFNIRVGDYIHTEKANFYVLKMSCDGRQLIEQNLTASGSQRRDEVAKDIAFEAVIAQEQMDEISEDVIDTIDIIEDIIEDQTDLEDTVEDIEESYGESDKLLSETVAAAQTTWDDNKYDIDEYGFGSPEVNYKITYVWDESPYSNINAVDKLPDINKIPSGVFDQEIYFYTQKDGVVYKPVKRIYKTGNFQKEFRRWEKIGQLLKKGEIQNADISPSDVGKTYLDQSTGYLYELQYSGERYKWVLKAKLEKVTVQLSTKIDQTNEAITLEAEKRYAEDSYQMAQIRIAADNITQEVTRAKGAEGTLSSRISQSAHSIELSTTDGAKTAGITIRIRDENGRVLDSTSDNITLTGVVGFEDLSGTGRTTINGANITTGYISADRIRVQDISLQTIASNTNSPITFKSSSGFVYGNEYYGTAVNSSGIKTSKISRNGYGYSGSLVIGETSEPIKMYASDFQLFGGSSRHLWTDSYNTVCEGEWKFNGDVKCPNLGHGSTSDYFVRVSGGKLVYTSSANTSSSQRYKYDIKPVENDELDPHKILKIPVKQFKFNNLSELPVSEQNKDVIGMIAEDIAHIYPVAATYNPYGQIENWNERYIIPAMLSLMQEMNQKIETLESKIKQLGGK